MASPAVVGTPSETAVSTASTSHTVNLPSGAAGNLFVAIMDKGSTSATVNSLTGWNELLDENSANGLYIAWKACDGTEGSTTGFTLSASTRGAWIVYEISGAADPTVLAPQVGTTSSGSSTAPDPPSVSVTGGPKDILTIACFGRGGEEADDDTWVSAAPSGFGSLLQKACGVAGTNLGGMVATAHLASTTATSNPGAFTCDTGAWRAQTVVVHPPPPTQTAVAEVSLASGSTPGSRTAHSIKVRARTTAGAGTLKAALYEGATNRSGDLESSALTTSLANYTLAVPDASAANITDYSNLSIRFWGYAVGGGSIVFEVDQLWLEIPASSGTTNTQALTATATTTATVVRSVGKLMTATTATTTATMVRRTGKIVSATATSTASVVKRVGKPITANATVTATIAAIRVVLLAMTATLTSTATITRRTGKIVSATATSTASMVKRVNKAVTANATVTASVAAIKVILKSMTATATSTATMVRRVGKPLSATVTSTASISRALALVRTLTATVTSTASIVKVVGKLVSATVTSTASLAAIRVFLRTLSATATSTATMTRQVGFHLSATVTSSATLVKQVGKRLSATATSTASMVAGRLVMRTLTATVTTTATMARMTAKAIQATVTATASVTKSIALTLSATVTTVASIFADFISGTVAFTLGFFDRPTPGGDTNDGSPDSSDFDPPSPGRSL